MIVSIHSIFQDTKVDHDPYEFKSLLVMADNFKL
jgi:hypothetical protein